VVAALLVGASAVAGCSSAAGSKASTQISHKAGVSMSAASLYQSPVQATLSWFFAVNHKDKTAAVAHFTTASAGQMDWGNGDTSTWSTFSALRCKQVSGSALSAVVYCTFKESAAPSVGNPDSFWTVSLDRQPDGRWLITNYGQG
jgi:hypothetical protein